MGDTIIFFPHQRILKSIFLPLQPTCHPKRLKNIFPKMGKEHGGVIKQLKNRNVRDKNKQTSFVSLLVPMFCQEYIVNHFLSWENSSKYCFLYLVELQGLEKVY